MNYKIKNIIIGFLIGILIFIIFDKINLIEGMKLSVINKLDRYDENIEKCNSYKGGVKNNKAYGNKCSLNYTDNCENLYEENETSIMIQDKIFKPKTLRIQCQNNYLESLNCTSYDLSNNLHICKTDDGMIENNLINIISSPIYYIKNFIKENLNDDSVSNKSSSLYDYVKDLNSSKPSMNTDSNDLMPRLSYSHKIHYSDNNSGNTPSDPPSPPPDPTPPDPTPPDPTPPDPTPPDPTHPDSPFPNGENSKLHIQILNSSTGPIRVWLDDLPFCPKMVAETDGSVSQEIKRNCGVYTNVDNPETNKKGNNWSKLFDLFNDDSQMENLMPRFYLINDGNQEEIQSSSIKRYFDLVQGEILKITPPHDYVNNNLVPQMCFYQKEDAQGITSDNSELRINDVTYTVNGENYQLNCAGAGIYFTEVPNPSDMYDNINVGPDAISRIEYNINGGEIYFNLSGVDGINARYSMDIVNELCEGGHKSSKCNIDLDSCFSETILKGFDASNMDHIDSNYLAFANGNPYIKSCPSPKFYYNQEGVLKGGDITRDNLLSGNSINECPNVINTDYWNTNITKSIIFSDSPINPGDRMTPDEANNIASAIGFHPDDILENAMLLKDTTGVNFGPGNFYNEIIINDKNKSFTNHNLAECPWGTEKEKALCHLWWGSSENRCANDWKEYLYDNPDVDTGSWDRYACNQYSWAYGEMGFDYTKRGPDGQSVTGTEGTDDNTIDGMKLKNSGYLIFYDGNPQQNFPTEYREGKWIWPIPDDSETNNLESFNKPLLNCPLHNGNDNHLANNPVYINIDIKEIMGGQYNLSDGQNAICDSLSNEQTCNTENKCYTGNSICSNINEFQCFQERLNYVGDNDNDFKYPFYCDNLS